MKARLKFCKIVTMKFIGHLDLMRYFQKAFRRCGIEISYSKGYSPHQILSFASPLGIGLTSSGEYLDMHLESSLSSQEMIEKINEAMNEEVSVLSFKKLPEDSKNSMSIVAAADYLVSLKDGYYLCDNFRKSFMEFINQDELLIMKKTKRSEKEIDLKPYIYKIEVDNTVFMQIATGSVVNIKPELIMEAFCKYKDITFNKYAFQVHRLEMYTNLSEKDEVMNLVTLEDLGEEIFKKEEYHEQ